jgi:hypothetical protein
MKIAAFGRMGKNGLVPFVHEEWEDEEKKKNHNVAPLKEVG